MEGSLDAGSIPASSIKKTPQGVFFVGWRESNGKTEERSDERTTRWVVRVEARPEPMSLLLQQLLDAAE